MKYHPYENLKFKNLGFFQSLKLRNLMGKIFRIILKLKFPPNTFGCNGLSIFQLLFHSRKQQLNQFQKKKKLTIF